MWKVETELALNGIFGMVIYSIDDPIVFWLYLEKFIENNLIRQIDNKQ